MLPNLTEKMSSELKHFYNKLEKVLVSEKVKFIEQSIFITFVKLPQNKITKFLLDASLSEKSFSDADITKLLNSGYINKTNDIEKSAYYTITAKGIWTVESHLDKVNIDKLLNYFQYSKFNSGVSEKPLTDIEKIILYSMLAMRNFSADYAMDINIKSKSDCWIEIFNISSTHLNSLKLIGKLDWFPSKSGNEHPVNHVMRRSQELPQKTRHIYVASGDYRYFLDIDNGTSESKLRLKFVFQLIYGKIDNRSDVRNEHIFLSNLAYDYGKNVRESFEYINPEWDTVLKEALEDFYYNQ